MILVGCGDSWCWGAELFDPKVTPQAKKEFVDHDEHYKLENEKFRLSRRYLTLFGNKINADKVVDLSLSSYSNEAIIRSLIRWLAINGYLKGKNTEELFVSIGWTSPERREHVSSDKSVGVIELPGILNDDGEPYIENWFQVGPWVDNIKYKNKDINRFMKLYVQYFWERKEYIHRWFSQVKQIELLLKSLGIKYVMHQAFYHLDFSHIMYWNDDEYRMKIEKEIPFYDMAIWDSVDEKHFINKNSETESTAYQYILNKVDGNFEAAFMHWHPNALGHNIWADYMYKFCTENKLL